MDNQPTTCYVAILEDRHIDAQAYVFSSEEKAVVFAKLTAREYCRGGELEEDLNDAMKADGWVYHCVYSCEGDNIRVIQCEIDSET